MSHCLLVLFQNQREEDDSNSNSNDTHNDSSESGFHSQQSDVAKVLAFSIMARRDNMTIGLDENDLADEQDEDDEWD